MNGVFGNGLGIGQGIGYIYIYIYRDMEGVYIGFSKGYIARARNGV